MNTKVRALIWEECRVSGVLAIYNLALGALLLALSWLGDYGYEWNFYRGFASCIVLGIPLLSVMLFTLGVNNSGHLTAGFPRRILNLPVRTSAAVSITLTMRTLFLLLLGFGLLGVCALRFGRAPWSAAILFIVSLYICVQMLDWVRQPISGMASLLILFLLALLVLMLGNMMDVIRSFKQTGFFSELDISTYWASVRLCVLYAAGLVISIVAVRATRRGKRVGPPELWELPALWSQHRHARQEPFSSPMDAAVWFERKRSPLVMPGLTLLIFSMLFTAIWLGTDRVKDTSANPDWTIYSSLDCVLLGSFLLAAMGYGLYRGAFRRKHISTPRMLPYLYPATAAEITSARIRAGALQAGMALLLIGLLYQGSFLLRYDGLASSVFSAALREGYVSWREVLWSFLSPLFLTGLVAWAFLSPNWLFWIAYIFLPIGASILVVICGFEDVDGVMNAANCLVIISAITLAAILAWRKGLMQGRTLAEVFGVWLLLAWLLYPMDVMASIDSKAISAYNMLQLLLSSLAWASLGPMPFIGTLIFSNAMRHSGLNCRQDPRQHTRRPSGHRVRNALAIAAVIALSLWFKWPVEPAWRTYLHEKGFTTSTHELHARREPVPDDENLALRYKAAGEKFDACTAELEARLDADQTHYTDSYGQSISAFDHFMEQLPIVGKGLQSLSNLPISPEQVPITRIYWDAVGKEVAPMLHAAAASGLTRGYNPDPSEYSPSDDYITYLNKARTLGPLLNLEALWACVENRPHDAVQAINAIYPLSFALRQDKLILSYINADVLMRMGINALESTLHGIVLSDSELVSLDHSLPSAQAMEQDDALQQFLIGESMKFLNLYAHGWIEDDLFQNMTDALPMPWRLVKPPLFEDAFLLHEINKNSNRSFPLVGDRNEEQTDENDSTRAYIYKWMRVSGYFGVEWRARTYLDLAHIGIAVERYRLATGHFPEKLEELVPTYISTIPQDPYTQMAAPLRYLLKPDGSCIVYSVFEDGTDDNGASFDRGTEKGDLIFTLLPPEQRTTVTPATNNADGV